MHQKIVYDNTFSRVLRLQSHDCIALLTHVCTAASRLVKAENVYWLIVGARGRCVQHACRLVVHCVLSHMQVWRRAVTRHICSQQ